ncbi:MAG: translation initiation factor IF-2, partial [Paludibacteraceae bacterium]|nr:translation initiation factor IF-2 [Paludibacteraceae bacterium]
MSIRLSKIAKELNVGVSTVVDFLNRKGHSIPSDLNYKLTDDEADMLYQEFSKDKKMKIDSEKVSQKRQVKEKRESVSIEGFGEQDEVIKPVISEEQKPKIKQVGKIDLENLNKPKKVKVEPKQPEIVEKSEPQKEVVEKFDVVEEPIKSEEKKEEEVPRREEVQETVQVSEIEEKQSQESVEDDNMIRLSKELKTNINVVGKIDLSSINQQTRPKKKSREERKKEREQRNKSFAKPQDNQFKSQQSSNANSDDDKKKKRKRIQKERIDIAEYKGGDEKARNNHGGENGGGNKKKGFKKNPIKPEVNEEEVQRQIKETLARLTNKGQKTKASKHRRDKREQQSLKMREQEELERLEQNRLKITEFVTVSELATMMNVSVAQVIGTCMSFGLMVSINQRLDAETINIVAEEFGFETEYISVDVAEAIHEEEDSEEELLPRPPIVTVMGHVDHGKTSLLDYIRNTNVIAGEAGGITQHIGAYNVTLADGQQITFLDTPGHEAFTAMRARGAKVTDIAIIIVAADDDVMPQTVEAINHASVAGVPIVFAINKIDKPTANPDKIKEALANMNYLVEEWGGKYQSQDIAAKKGTGVAELMEKVLLEAEMLDLKANPNRRASGTIIESQVDKGRGYVSSVLVSNGTLMVGDVVVAGIHHGRIKAMFNERGQRIKEARPAEPALILGLNGAPQSGDNFNVLESEQEAREIANKREQLLREHNARTSTHVTLEEIARRRALGNFQEMNIIVKGDVDGSVEALSDSLLKLSTEQFQVNVIHKAVGQISESDVMLAAASDAIIVGFQ